ncbi:Serine/threonine-phosphatase 2A 55 kDa regulatory subunit B -like protein [Sarcoptes scabiei]|uniref:Serine/threonine-protein phosphatase 2A 55 kDa regulatory subunit B n=1 Tax=Sarcoptes scabiei TaxID=52283 RepID=A0A132A4X6_SARSC|nr:Serine/threonine-phosphatase 2A 55 kDa regulatory subunit B -like protein [Sarcoptes scabiei]
MARQSILNFNKNQNSDLQWSFLQVKGTFEDDFTDGKSIDYDEIKPRFKDFIHSLSHEADLISCVEFNSTGNLLACGDKGGRIVIFQRNDTNKTIDYDVYCTFQSHEAEFDYLKSLEIEEKINKICWLNASKTATNHYMLTTNDKTIKLWKMSERDKRVDDNSCNNVTKNLYFNDGFESREDYEQFDLKVPKILPVEPMIQTNLRKMFSNAHTFHINSISINSDQETFISADELRINLWHLEVTDESFVIVDVKPSNMEDLNEVISAASFHPQHCHIFGYSTSRGSIKLCDMREAALCDQYSKIFQDLNPEAQTSNFFNELTSVISDLKFSNNGRFMVTRDYMTVKVWDLNMERQPVETYRVHEYLRSKLCSLYENDYIFDKFEFSLSGNDSHIMTGSYNLFRIIDRETKQESLFEINKNVIKQKYLRPQKVIANGSNILKKYKKDEIPVDSIDLNRRIYHTAWSPTDNVIAIAVTKNLFFFQSH